MGHIIAVGYADAVAEGSASVEAALVAHLTTNFYPPLPAAYAPPTAWAIQLVNDGLGFTHVLLDKNIEPVPAVAEFDEVLDAWVVSANDLVRITKTAPFLEEEEV